MNLFRFIIWVAILIFTVMNLINGDHYCVAAIWCIVWFALFIVNIFLDEKRKEKQTLPKMELGDAWANIVTVKENYGEYIGYVSTETITEVLDSGNAFVTVRYLNHNGELQTHLRCYRDPQDFLGKIKLN